MLFAAVCAYAMAHFAQFLENSRYEVLAEKTVTDSIALDGIALRTEQSVCLEGEPMLLCESGERVAAKQNFAECGGERIAGDESAIFFKNCDGYEYLSVTEDTFSPDRLNELLSAEKHDEAAVGRLVKGRNWYFAAAADAQDIPCGTVAVKFEGFDERIEAALVRSCPDGKEKSAVLLKLRIGKNEYLSLRRCRGEIIQNEITGLAVPKAAVIRAGEGNASVLRRTPAGEKSCPVDILYENENYFLIKPTDELYAGAKIKMQ